LLLTITLTGALLHANRRRGELSWAKDIQTAFNAYDEDGDNPLTDPKSKRCSATMWSNT
jgi:hypothetical protein